MPWAAAHRKRRDFVDATIHSESFLGRPFFDVGQVRSLLARHLEGEPGIHPDVWRWVHLETWMRKFID